VADLRETFDARGVVRREGALRHWSNGNLQVFVEPTPTGQRVRLRATNAAAQIWITGSLAILGVGAASAIATMVGGSTPGTATTITGLAVIGLGVLAINAIRLPRWARTRREQMAAIVHRLAR
jgi:hypothetical protein